MGSGEVAIVALSTMISLKVTFSDGLGGVTYCFSCFDGKDSAFPMACKGEIHKAKGEFP